MRPKSQAPLAHDAIVVLLLAVATALKATWAVSSAGSADLYLGYMYGRALQDVSIGFFYLTSVLFNETPVTAYVMRTLFAVSQSDFTIFAAALRFLGILADIAVVLALLHVRRLTGRPAWWMIGLFALSPVAIMVSGYHGDVDPIMVALLFFSGVAVLHEWPLMCGALFAMAVNLKAAPLLLAPIYLAYWFARDRRAACSFSLIAVLILLMGNSRPLLSYPGAFLANVFGPGAHWGGWGLTFGLHLAGLPQRIAILHGPTHAQSLAVGGLLATTFAAICLLALRRRRQPPEQFLQTLAMGLIILLVLSPGAGPQQMIWFSPFLLLLSGRWWVALNAASTVFLLAFYQSTMKTPFPWIAPVTGPPGLWPATPWALLPWAGLIMLLLTQAKTWFLGAQVARVNGAEGNEVVAR